MTKTYYTLAIRTDGIWRAEFGAYDKADVQAEMEDYLDHDTLRKDAKLVSSGDTQLDIDGAIATLNA